jgi:ferredoxin-type protein NapF
VLFTAVALAWPGGAGSNASVLLPALSPFIAMAGALSARTVSVLTLLAVPVLLLTVISPRWFCRWGCPTGLLQEWVGRTRPAGNGRWRRGPRFGSWLALLTLGGSLLGYPLFLWLDPLALFNGSLNAWRQPLAVTTLLTGLGLPLLLGLERFAPGLWCQRLCPLGGTQDLAQGPRRWFRRTAPDPAGELVVRGGDGMQAGRRWFFGLCAGAAGAYAAKSVRGGVASTLRPPGALDAGRFTGVCVRCGNCARACPSRIIEPDLGAGGLPGLFAPRLRFEADYCREDCHRCGEVCPSGALARWSPGDKPRVRIGRAVVWDELCLLAQGRECTACLRKCPWAALTMESADGGFSNRPVVNPDRCNGCGACEAVCPVRPARAIRVEVLSDPTPRPPTPVAA